MNQVYLRPLEATDLEQIHRWHNDAELYQHLVGNYRNVTLDDVARWLTQRMSNGSTERNFAICETGSGRHLGNLYLRNIDSVAGEAELHIFLGDASSRGAGRGTAALQLALKIAFETERLSRLYLHVLATNLAAIRLYERTGFRFEDRLTEATVKNGVPTEVLRMTMKSPYLPKSPEL